MNNFERFVFAFLFAWVGCLVSNSPAQSRGPLVKREKTTPSAEVVDENAPIKPARWPFNLGRLLFDRKDDQNNATSGDPFLNQGADEQQQLAAQLAARHGIQTGTMGGVRQQAPIAPGQIKTQSYPWPSPVDSNSQPPAVPDGTTWKGGTDGTPGIVDRIRQASAKALQRNQTSVASAFSATQPASADMPPPQSANDVDDTDYAAQAVNKYLKRVEQEGSVSGKIFNPLVESASPQPATQTAQQSPDTATFAGNTLPPPRQARAPNYALPKYVQPVTRYVSGMPPASPPTTAYSTATPSAPAYVANAVGPTQQPFSTAQAPLSASTGVVTSPQVMAQPIPAMQRASEFPLGDVQATTATSAAAAPTPPASLPVGSQINATPVTPPEAAPQLTAPNTNRSLGTPDKNSLGTPDKNTRVLAIVGDQTILAGDVMTQVEQMLGPYRDQMTDEQFQEQTDLLLQRVLPRLVENKLVYLDFLRTVPPDKIPELESKVFEFFSESKLPEMREKLSVTTTAELDAKLREMGSSLAKQQRLFLEKFVGTEAVRRNVDIDAEITHEELLDYYRTHQEGYSYPSRVRWERLSVEIAKFGSQEEALNALAQMGNEVMHGFELKEVAQKGSHGPQADEGGQYDWTTQGSLRSKTIEELIFTLPPGKLSRIVEDEGALHIVRVIERQDAGTEKFTDVQDKITEKIKEERYRVGAEDYLARLRRETHVSTIFDDQRPLR